MSIVRGFIFGTSIMATSRSIRHCGKLSDIGPRNIPLQPPNWVFRVVWPCLFGTTGVAWALAGNRADFSLGIVTLLCCLWLVVYACWKRKLAATFTLAGTVVATIVAALHLRGVSGWLLLPLALWTTFATYLNAYDAIHPPPPT